MAHSVNHLTPPEPAEAPETFDPFSPEAASDALNLAVDAATLHSPTVAIVPNIKVAIDRRKSQNDFVELIIDGEEVAGEVQYAPNLQEAYDWAIQAIMRGILENRFKVSINRDVAR